jgi:putative methyltransferase (TIGR04325 family)
MTEFRRAALRMLPPIAVDAARRVRDAMGGPPEWEYVVDGWPLPDPQDPGWNDESVVVTQTAKWEEYRRLTGGIGPLAIAHEAATMSNDIPAVHNDVMAFGYVLARTAHMREQISILDWGGGLGHFRPLAQALMPEVHIDYHCKDVPQLVRKGRELFPDAHFYDTEDEAFARDYDLVMASNSLQYSRDWFSVLPKMAAAARQFLYVTNLPLVRRAPSFVVLQRPHRYGYCTEYPCWFLNREAFLQGVGAGGMVQLREFLTDTHVVVPRAPEQVKFCGFLFAPQTSQRRSEG